MIYDDFIERQNHFKYIITYHIQFDVGFITF